MAASHASQEGRSGICFFLVESAQQATSRRKPVEPRPSLCQATKRVQASKLIPGINEEREANFPESLERREMENFPFPVKRCFPRDNELKVSISDASLVLLCSRAAWLAPDCQCCLVV